LLAAYPDLAQIAEETKQAAKQAGLDIEDSIDLMATKFARWCEDQFGAVIALVLPAVKEIVALGIKTVDRLEPLYQGAPPTKPGRKNTTKDIADFAAARRGKQTWKDTAQEWNKKHPDRHVTANKVRDAWRREHGDKAKLLKKLRGKH
jgi:hypothetical protein